MQQMASSFWPSHCKIILLSPLLFKISDYVNIKSDIYSHCIHLWYLINHCLKSMHTYVLNQCKYHNSLFCRKLLTVLCSHVYHWTEFYWLQMTALTQWIPGINIQFHRFMASVEICQLHMTRLRRKHCGNRHLFAVLFTFCQQKKEQSFNQSINQIQFC